MDKFSKPPKRLLKDWEFIKKYEVMSGYYGVRKHKILNCMLFLFGKDEACDVFNDARDYLSFYFPPNKDELNEYQKFLITYYYSGKSDTPFYKYREELYTLIWNKLFKCALDYNTNDLIVYPASLYYNLLHSIAIYEERKQDKYK